MAIRLLRYADGFSAESAPPAFLSFTLSSRTLSLPFPHFLLPFSPLFPHSTSDGSAIKPSTFRTVFRFPRRLPAASFHCQATVPLPHLSPCQAHSQLISPSNLSSSSPEVSFGVLLLVPCWWLCLQSLHVLCILYLVLNQGSRTLGLKSTTLCPLILVTVLAAPSQSPRPPK
jgi:hypothetical protein